MDDVSLSVLGPMRVRVDGREVRVGAPRPRTVLALLAAAAGRVVPAGTLIEQVWPERPPGRADTTLHGCIASLRRILEPGGEAHRLVVRDGDGYALRLPRLSVDADRFERAAAEAHTALVAHRPAAAAAVLDTALPLWRGRPYEDVPDVPLLASHAARLQDVRAGMDVDRQAAAIALGEHAATIAPLTALVERSPLDERLSELLALAQYRAGRQDDALATLRAVRRRLTAELGVDAGDRLRRLEELILVQAPVLSGAETVHPAPRSPGQLPAALDETVGRGPAAEQVATLLAGQRLVTLVGPAGVGKTRLALDVARPSAAARLVELAAVRDTERLAATVAGALGLVGVEDTERLTDVLRTRQTLLVLDNCEHLAGGAADLVTALLQGCPGVRVLATSRQPLRVAGETIVDVAPLPLDDAAELFVRRARPARPGWSADAADERLIRRICVAVDGLPLAVEIAAARSRVLPLDRLAGDLAAGAGLGLLDDGARGGPARHRSVAAALRWGYTLLRPAEQDLLRAVSVFAGGFTLDAVDVLVAGLAPEAPAAPADGIGNLVDRSLVVREPGDRYRLLETVRQFAAGEQDDAERDATRRAHLRWTVQLVEEADRAMVAGGAGYWGARLAGERDNIRAAFGTARDDGDHESGQRIAAALLWFWYRWGAVVEGTALLREFLAHAGRDGVPAAVTARAWFALGALRYLAGDIREAHTLTTLARDLASLAGDTVTEARCLGYAAHFAVLAGADPLRAAAAAERGTRLAAATGLDWVRAEASASLGLVHSLVTGAQAAVPHLDTAWRTAVRCGHEWVACSAAWALIRIERERGRPRVAAALGAAVLAHLHRSGDRTSWLMIAQSTAGALADLPASDGADPPCAGDGADPRSAGDGAGPRSASDGAGPLCAGDGADPPSADPSSVGPPAEDGARVGALRGPAADAAVLLGAVDAMAAELGVAVERIDPLHAPAVRAAVRAALPAGQFDLAAHRGRALRRPDVVALLRPYR